ncbi:polyprenyl synthetase family protein [Thermophagus xiamenensis]|jgi:octaprenyl-diphosphate synthase|uniref:Octaprenyl-diphosphate synthase n=1 Tax=Thermophagus xiamenensis TaxID=385682 RepID=A0A1I2D0X7_9BACT|nr:polyprenyl synthetase family protein [Thermophagus xiamenensis]SFE73650.1 octaprenyl-diphosphate synthase [Thermophagus xiamenensis]
MKISTKILSPIKEEMKEFGIYYKKNFDTNFPLLNIITNYLIRRKGKQMRPMLVFLSAKLNGSVNKGTYNAAGLIELLHNATLIHDDVVDETYQRRGFFSINALWRSKIAVLVGDYFLAMGLIKSLEENQTEILRIISTAVKEMSEGELLQIEKSRNLSITEDIYYEIIRKKTATLIAACTAAGAHSVGAPKENTTKMHDFGLNLGIAFQIRDDLLDYEQTNFAGKPTGNDLKEKKMTLPLIYVLSKQSNWKRREILRTIKRHHKNEKKIAPIVEFVKQQGGIEYARKKMIEYRNKALDILNTYPESDAREGLKELVIFTTTRKG